MLPDCRRWLRRTGGSTCTEWTARRGVCADTAEAVVTPRAATTPGSGCSSSSAAGLPGLCRAQRGNGLLAHDPRAGERDGQDGLDEVRPGDAQCPAPEARCRRAELDVERHVLAG